MVAGGLPPSRTPPVYSAFGLVRRSSASPFRSPFESSLGEGAPTPPHLPPFTRPSASCAARALRPFGRTRCCYCIMLGGGTLPPLHPSCWPAFGRQEILRALDPFRRFLNHHWAGVLSLPRTPPAGRPSAGGESSSASPFRSLSSFGRGAAQPEHHGM